MVVRPSHIFVGRVLLMISLVTNEPYAGSELLVTVRMRQQTLGHVACLFGLSLLSAFLWAWRVISSSY